MGLVELVPGLTTLYKIENISKEYAMNDIWMVVGKSNKNR